MRIEDHRPNETIERVASTLELCFRALSQGIELADGMHARYSWNPKDDPHMFSHAVRREALEVLRAQKVEAEEESEFAPMSALHLKVAGTDAIRVWHGTRGQLRAPSSDSGLKFVRQPPSTALQLPGFEPAPVPERCHTILMWEHADGQLSRFTLVRPLDADSGKVIVDWQEPLLLRFATHVEDVQYKRRDTGAAEDSQTS